MKHYYLLLTKQQALERGYFQDSDGDFWEKGEYRDYYNRIDGDEQEPEGFSTSLCLTLRECGQVKTVSTPHSDWRIQRELFPETDPEYFI